PEDVPGPSRATRHQVTILVLGADHLERERWRRRRTVLLDELAVGIARAADERSEAPALARERPQAALGADLARARLRRRLGGPDRPGLPVVGATRVTGVSGAA